MSVIPEYGVGILALTAGSMVALPPILDVTLSTIVPAVDEAAREEAGRTYARKFQSGCDRKNGTRFGAVIKQDQDSFLLDSITGGNDTDQKTALTDIWGYTIGQYIGTVGKTVRMFPTDLTEDATMDGRAVTREVWRLWPDLHLVPDSDLPGIGLMARDCMTWSIVDWVHYGGEPLDRVMIYRGPRGEAMGLEIPFLRSGILRAT